MMREPQPPGSAGPDPARGRPARRARLVASGASVAVTAVAVGFMADASRDAAADRTGEALGLVSGIAGVVGEPIPQAGEAAVEEVDATVVDSGSALPIPRVAGAGVS